MNHFTVVTEGETDRVLLQTLLDIPPNDDYFRVVAAGGWSSADSYARSLLLRGEDHVALVVDADSNDAKQVESRRSFLQQSLKSIPSMGKRKVLVIEPEIEALIFRDHDVVEAMVGHSLSEIDLLRSSYEPKKVLTDLIQPRSLLETYRRLLPQLHLSSLRNEPEIRELKIFLENAKQRSKTGASSSD